MTGVALIQAGGEGRRMRETLGEASKPLVCVRGVPLIERNLIALLRAGFREIHVSVTRNDQRLRAYLESRGRALAQARGATITLLVEEHPLGTIGCASRLRDVTSELLVVNADNLTTLELGELAASHRRAGAALSLAIHTEIFRLPYGEVVIEDGEVRIYREKPELAVRVASAVSVLGRTALQQIPKEQPFGLPDLVQALLERGERVRAHEHDAPWIDVNDANAERRAEALVARYQISFERWPNPPDLEVVGALLWGPKGILLERRPAGAELYPDQWDTPGGKMEAGESPSVALARELEEELGLREVFTDPLAVFDDVDVTSGRIVRHHIFSRRIDPATVTSREARQLGWFSVAGLGGVPELCPVVRRSLAASAAPSGRPDLATL